MGKWNPKDVKQAAKKAAQIKAAKMDREGVNVHDARSPQEA